jgi:hypothetical protein
MMRTIADVLFGTALSFVVALAGRVLFGTIPDVPIWRVLFFGLASGYLIGYLVASSGGVVHDEPRAITPRRHRIVPTNGGDSRPGSRGRMI